MNNTPVRWKPFGTFGTAFPEISRWWMLLVLASRITSNQIRRNNLSPRRKRIWTTSILFPLSLFSQRLLWLETSFQVTATIRTGEGNNRNDNFRWETSSSCEYKSSMDSRVQRRECFIDG